MKSALLLPFLLAFTASAFEFTGKVVGVTDGDTITVLFEGKNQVLCYIYFPFSSTPFTLSTTSHSSGKSIKSISPFV